ncbi:PREDICTED: histone H2B type 3-B-like [Nanorana parkeri]|uniref:histone H2B type 3-B-like n=1 Tax=Nanorana parkeri TaxID=125878 RepID=UPI00085508E1|nr:PREDICTED: histone H2B type 3-B-like [Nanorana parkeri]
MKSSPATVKRMEAMSKNIPQRTVGRMMRAKYSNYIYRVIKQDSQAQDTHISKDLMLSIASEAARLCLYNKRRTITRREVESAMKNVLSGGDPTALEE